MLGRRGVRRAWVWSLALGATLGCGGAVDVVSAEGPPLDEGGDEPPTLEPTRRPLAPALPPSVHGGQDALAGCAHPFAGGGRVASAAGCVPWGSSVLRYKSVGGVVSGTRRIVATPASRGDDEVLAIGASHGGNDALDVDTYMDATRLRSEGFRAVGVRGSRDKKVELWARRNGGQGTVNLPALAKAYSIVAFTSDGGANVRAALDLDAIRAGTVKGASATSWSTPVVSGTDLRVLAYFGDDSFEVVDARPGGIVFNVWGFGDGDSLNVMVFGPSQSTPARVPVRRHDVGGSQYVGILANFPAK